MFDWWSLIVCSTADTLLCSVVQEGFGPGQPGRANLCSGRSGWHHLFQHRGTIRPSHGYMDIRCLHADSPGWGRTDRSQGQCCVHTFFQLDMMSLVYLNVWWNGNISPLNVFHPDATFTGGWVLDIKNQPSLYCRFSYRACVGIVSFCVDFGQDGCASVFLLFQVPVWCHYQ